MQNICAVQRLGVMAYEQAWQLQKRLAAEIAAGQRPATLLLLQHPHTFTFGRRGQLANLIWDEAELARRGIDVHWVDRGGDVTYHGPGQLVGYPLLPLDTSGLQASGPDSAHLPHADYVGYVRRLENGLILALSRCGVPAARMEGLTGVWVQPEVRSRCLSCDPQDRLRPAKIAAIGVKVDARGITQHGFALNIHPDMQYWEGIVGCGLKDYAVISMAELQASPPDFAAVEKAVEQAFGEVFAFQMQAAEQALESN